MFKICKLLAAAGLCAASASANAATFIIEATGVVEYSLDVENRFGQGAELGALNGLGAVVQYTFDNSVTPANTQTFNSAIYNQSFIESGAAGPFFLSEVKFSVNGVELFASNPSTTQGIARGNIFAPNNFGYPYDVFSVNYADQNVASFLVVQTQAILPENTIIYDNFSQTFDSPGLNNPSSYLSLGYNAGNVQAGVRARLTSISQIGAAAVPEPATWVTMLVGFGLVGGAMRRRQRTAFRLSFS